MEEPHAHSREPRPLLRTRGDDRAPVPTWVMLLFLAALAGLSYLVLKDFLAPLAWAGILAYITWPVHHRLLETLNYRAGLAALVMTLALTVAIVAPLVGLVFWLREELAGIYGLLADYLAHGAPGLSEVLASIPWVGERLQETVARLSADPEALSQQFTEWAREWGGEVAGVVGNIGWNVAKLGIALLALFFVYRDGAVLANQVRTVVWRFLGVRGSGYLQAVAVTTRGVVYGVVLTALAQGMLAGLGYWAAGVPAPASLGMLTALLAIVPFGAPLVWVPAGLWLLLQGAPLAGVGLLLWGVLVVGLVDNLIRPLAISTASRVPFLLVMLGVIGGLRAFGLVGLFLGPIILAVLLGVWREWLEESRGREAAPVRAGEPPEGGPHGSG